MNSIYNLLSVYFIYIRIILLECFFIIKCYSYILAKITIFAELSTSEQARNSPVVKKNYFHFVFDCHCEVFSNGKVNIYN